MAALFTLLLGCCALLLGYFLYDFGRQNFIRETEAAIDMEMEHILILTQDMDAAARRDFIDVKTRDLRHPVYLLLDKAGERIAGNLAQVPLVVERLSEGVLRFTHRLAEDDRQMAAKIHTFEDGSRLLIARDITDILDQYMRLRVITGLVIGFMLVVVVVSFFISVFVVRRINVIARTARAIMDTGDLSRRIAVEGSWDDLSNLAQILNALLQRIEGLMQGIRDVSDSIAHDLRTPLTRLRNQLEVMSKGEVTEAQLKDVLAEADGMLNVFQALLRIANIEKGKRYQAFDDVDLGAIIRDVIELYEPVAEELSLLIHFESVADAPYYGDRDLLFQAIANLLDNAIKFSPRGGTIDVVLSAECDRWRLVIADCGMGVTDADKPHIFDRFYRADASRSQSGSGLGLSLVKAIMELHKAQLLLEDNQPGLRVVVQF